MSYPAIGNLYYYGIKRQPAQRYYRRLPRPFGFRSGDLSTTSARAAGVEPHRCIAPAGARGRGFRGRTAVTNRMAAPSC
jgi:hypothetical protein